MHPYVRCARPRVDLVTPRSRKRRTNKAVQLLAERCLQLNLSIRLYCPEYYTVICVNLVRGIDQWRLSVNYKTYFAVPYRSGSAKWLRLIWSEQNKQRVLLPIKIVNFSVLVCKRNVDFTQSIVVYRNNKNDNIEERTFLGGLTFSNKHHCRPNERKYGNVNKYYVLLI